MAGLPQDVRYALRAIRRAPLFSAIAIGGLAIAMGVNGAAFSMLDALMVRDLPGISRQYELNTVLISHKTRWGMTGPSTISTLDWEVFRGAIPGFSSSNVAGTASVALRLGGEPRAVRADFVSGDYFTTLGTRPAAGRLLSSSDDQAGAPLAAVISYDLWTREHDRRPDAIGKPVQVGNVAFTIVGVTPKGFTGLYPGELTADLEHGAPFVFLPVVAAALVRAESRYASVSANLGDQWLLLAGRRRPGVSVAEVDAQAARVAARLAAAYPKERERATTRIRTPSTASTAEMLAVIGFVMAIPLLILLVACANLANQLLARAVQRSSEIAVRLSLGATRARLVRQLLIESLVLALLASVAAVGFARVVTDVVGTVVLVMPFRIPIDLRVIGFTVALALLTTLAFGMLPALRATRVDLAQAVKESAKGGGYRRSRLRSALVVTQVAASVALLALAGVFGRASQRSRVLESKENATRLVTLAVDLDLLGYAAPAGQAFQAAALERLRALPGVEAAALVRFGPVASTPEERVTLAGETREQGRWYDVVPVTRDWFLARNTPPVAGRLYGPGETGVAVVDEVAAAELWPGASALGQTLRIGEGGGDSAAVATVIGVVPTLPDPRAEEPEGLIAVPPDGSYSPQAHFYVRARGDAGPLRASIVGALRELDERLPLGSLATLGESLASVTSGVQQIATGVGALGGIALLLATLGLWAVLSFIVEQRRYEIGVRIALGARPLLVTRMVLRQSLALAGIGIVAGLLVAGASATFLRGILFGLPPLDLAAFAGSTAIILVIALLSSLGPAHRANRVDPMVALRAE